MKNNFKKRVAFLIIIFSIFLTYFFFGESIRFIKIKSDISNIDTDSLSKYYQLFLVENNKEIYNEIDFCKFLEKRNIILKKQLERYDIKLNSVLESEQKNVFMGFYHIGPDRIDNNMDNMITDFEINSLNGDIGIPTINYFKLNFNTIYSISNNELINLGIFNPVLIVEKSINCIDGEVKIKIDTVEFKKNRITFHNKKVKIKNKIDEETLSILLSDSLLKTAVKDNNFLYIPINSYFPKDYFYCDKAPPPQTK
jgi:hypothetical protein